MRIEIYPYDSASPLGLAGHGNFFMAANGTYVGIFSGNAITETNQPSALYMATSADGLAWGNYRQLYPYYHDPTVVKQDGRYYLYGMYLHYHSARGISADGLAWPAALERITFLDGLGTVLDDKGVGDLGSTVNPDGDIMLYSNFGDPMPQIVYHQRQAAGQPAQAPRLYLPFTLTSSQRQSGTIR